jgi:hypothetical protein
VDEQEPRPDDRDSLGRDPQPDHHAARRLTPLSHRSSTGPVAPPGNDHRVRRLVAMPSLSRVSSSRALIGLLAGAFVAALGLAATPLAAAPAHPTSSSTVHTTSAHTTSAPAPSANSARRLLSWSGITWIVYPDSAKGPENTPLSNAANSVYVDGRGRLHLKILKIHGVWRSVELQSLNPVGYGTYRLINDTATAQFSNRTVFGMFVYQPHTKKYTNEIDVEDSRFPRYLPAPNNAQFAVQPYKSPGHEHHYQVKSSYVPLFQEFNWYPPIRGKGTVSFETRVGATATSPLLTRWTYFGNSDPTTNGLRPMYLYLDLWLNKNQPPTHGTHSAILRSLRVTPFGS